jgi:hypothetical protein
MARKAPQGPGSFFGEDLPRARSSTGSPFAWPLGLDGGDWLIGLGALVALIFCFRAQGDPFTWLLLGLLPPGLRLLISPAYRQRLSAWLRRTWQATETFCDNGGPVPWRTAFVFASLPAAFLYLFDDRVMNAVDTMALLPTAVSLVREGNWDLDEYVPRGLPDKQMPVFYRRSGKHIYANWPVGMVQFAAPVTAVAHAAGADLTRDEVYLRLEKWTAAWLAALSVGLFFLLALHLAPPAPALACTLVLATGSTMYSTVAMALWHQDALVFYSLLVLYLEFRQQEGPSWPATILQGAACGLMLPCRLSAGLFIGAFGVWVLLRSWRRALVVAAIALLAYAPWVHLYSTMSGNVGDPLAVKKTVGGGLTWDVLPRLAGVLVSPGRGLLVYQPWILLGTALLLPWVRRTAKAIPVPARLPPGWQWLCAAVVVGQIAVISAWAGWWGGYCWGSRLAAEVVPLLALLCVRPIAALWEADWGRRAIAAVGALAFVLHLSAVHFNADQWNAAQKIDSHPAKLWSWSDAPFLYWRL